MLFFPEFTFDDSIIRGGFGLMVVAVEAVLIDIFVRYQRHEYLKKERYHYSIVQGTRNEIRVNKVDQREKGKDLY